MKLVTDPRSGPHRRVCLFNPSDFDLRCAAKRAATLGPGPLPAPSRAVRRKLRTARGGGRGGRRGGVGRP